MIIPAELRYANIKVDDEHSVPYPDDDYCKNALAELEYALFVYDAYYKDKEFEIVFGNGDRFVFSISPLNLCEILGIDFNDLQDRGVFDELKCNNDKRTPYDLLRFMVEHEHDIISLNRNYSLFNFYAIKIRSGMFAKFSDLREFNFGYLNYDNSVTKEQWVPIGIKAHKFLFVESYDLGYPYYMMAIPNEDRDINCVEALFPIMNPEKVFSEQEISMPIMASVGAPNDYMTIEASPSQKLRTVTSLSYIVDKCNANLSFFKDYYSILMKNARNEKRQKGE